MNKLAVLLSIVSLLAFTSPVLAQSQRGVAARQAQADNNTNRNQRISEVLDRIIDKATTRYQRYEEFIGKLESRRARLAETGVDVTELDNSIRLSKSALGNVRGTINTAKETFANLDLSQNPGEIRRQVVAEITNIRQAFRELHRSVANAVAIASRLSN